MYVLKIFITGSDIVILALLVLLMCPENDETAV